MAVGGIVLERGHQRRHGRPALARFGSQAAHERAANPRRYFVVLGNRSQVAAAHVVEQLEQRLAGERALAIERLVERHAEA